MNLFALKYVGVILLASQMVLPYAGFPAILYSNKAVMNEIEESIPQTDTFFQEKGEIETVAFELKEDEHSLGTFELNMETRIAYVEDLSVEWMDDLSDVPLHTSFFENNQINLSQPAFVLRSSDGEKEEWFFVSEDLSYSDSDSHYELRIQNIACAGDLEV